ncbi:MAG: M48 family metalloprotease [Cycloclasticus sp.]|nr:M48 family metalloprotease [Cycloclasticus sp.]
MIERRCMLITLALLISGCAVNPATGERDFVLMSENEELALGRQYSQQVMKEYRAYDNATLQQYVQSVGDRVARESHRKNLFYRFTLLDSTQVNAFALPGGYIYITRGLLVYLNSEAELAAVLGHELGHVTARHSVRQHGLATATNVLGSILATTSGVQGVGQLTNLLSTGIVRGYGREHELEADGLGVDYLVKAGYPASAMKKVITTLKNQELFDKKLAKEQGREPRAYHGVFSTHPKNDTRLQEVLSRAGKQLKSTTVSDKQDANFLNHLVGLTFGDSEKDGITRGNNFYHPDLNFKIIFPKNWLISNSSQAIAAASPGDTAFMQLVLQDLNQKMTPQQFLKTRLGISGVISEAPLSIGPFAGHTVVVNGKTPYGQRKMRVAVLYDGPRAFIFFAATKKNNSFEQFDSQFLARINSFSRLSRDDRKNATELTLQLTRVVRGMVLHDLTKASPITHHAEDQLRLLNGIFPVGEPKSGDLMKIVR